MFNREQKILVRQFLQSVVKGDLSVIDTKTLGICHSMSKVLNHSIAYRFVSDNSNDWKHFSGCRINPIPKSFWCSKLWKRSQLKLRKSLCLHLLTKLD
jgi:hypothetical protein